MAKGKNHAKRTEIARPEETPFFRFGRFLTISIVVIWAGLVAYNYFKSQPFPIRLITIPDLPLFFKRILQTVFQSLLPVFWMLALTFVSCRLGGRILSFFKLETERLENIVFSTGLGITALIYLTLFSGFLGLLYPLYVKIAVLVLLAASLWGFRPAADLSAVKEQKFHINEIAMLCLCGAIFLLNALMAIMPENFYDALVYQLAVPNLYVLNHKIAPIDYLMHSNFPLNINMLYTLSLLLSNEILAKLMHFVLTFVSVAVIFAIGRRFYNATVGLMAALIYYSLPIVLFNSWGCGNDSGLTFFFALSLFSFMLWVDKNKYQYLWLSAIFLGAAAAAKYTAAFLAAALTTAVLVHLIRSCPGKREVMKKFAVFSLIVLAFILPYLIKNYFFTGNPVYPFFYKILGGRGLYDFGGGGAIIATPLAIFSFKLMDFLKSPWVMTIYSGESQNMIGPLLLSLTPFILLFRNMERKLSYLILTFLLSYCFWYLGTPLFRYLIPSFALLAIFFAYYAEKIAKNPFFMAFFYFCILSNIFFSLNVAWGLKVSQYLCKNSDKNSFLAVSQTGCPNPSYSVIKWINENLPANSRILFSAENKAFYLKRDYVSYSVETNLQPLMELLKQAEDGDDFKKILDDNRITHILINYREAIRVNPIYKTYYWNERDRKVFNEFWEKRIKLEYFKEGAYLYSVAGGGTRVEPNILEELEKNGWTTQSFFTILERFRMWPDLIDEYKNRIPYGYDVQPQLKALYKLAGQTK